MADRLSASAVTSMPTRLAEALVLYALHEHLHGDARRLEVRITPRCFSIRDDGRGMGLDREDYVTGLMTLLAEGEMPADIALHGVGLSLVATSTPRLAIESRRASGIWTQTFRWGVPEAPARWIAAPQGSGTRIEFDVATGDTDIDVEALRARFDAWRKALPDLVLDVA